jgi:hypothetical protein
MRRNTFPGVILVLLLGILFLPLGGVLVPFYFPGAALPLNKMFNFLTILILVIYDTSSIREPPKVS